MHKILFYKIHLGFFMGIILKNISQKSLYFVSFSCRIFLAFKCDHDTRIYPLIHIKIDQ